MSEQKPITKVPDGHTRFYTTRQKAPNEKGFVGYETVWKPFQKEPNTRRRRSPRGQRRAVTGAPGAIDHLLPGAPQNQIPSRSSAIGFLLRV